MQLGTHLPLERESTLRLTLVQAVSSGDRTDYTLQKAVELGIGAIQPVFSERSVVKLAGERADKRMALARRIDRQLRAMRPQ